MPALAVAPKGSIQVPVPTDWGVLDGTRAASENGSSALGDPAVVAAANDALAGVYALDAARTPATGTFNLVADVPPPSPQPTALEGVSQSPYTNLTNLLDILFDQPLVVVVKVVSGEHVNWVEVRLLPNILGEVAWVPVNIDNDSSTGDAAGNDIRLRIRPVRDRMDTNWTLIPPRFEFILRGTGLAAEFERLDPSSSELPLNTTFMKWFRYNEINYTWFIEYGIPRLPGRSILSITTAQVVVGAGGGNVLQLIWNALNGSIGNNTDILGDISGPYTLSHYVDEPLSSLHASLGYVRILTPGDEEPRLDTASWLTVHMRPSVLYPRIPSTFGLWLDSPAFNRSFDHLNWTAELPSVLEIEYVDDRGDNYTQARGYVDEMPRNFRVEIDNVTEPVGSVSKVHYRTSEPVGTILFDEWEFFGKGRRDQFLHSHVELHGLPRELWLNGTLDIGGEAFGVLRPDRTVRNIVPQLLDSLMVRIASKLFTIGRTLRSIPQNILNMPDSRGYTTIELPLQGSYLGSIEFWLSSGHHVTVAPESDFFAFYNDTLADVTGKMVKTSFAGRLLDIREMRTSFIDVKRISFESRYNRELRALFVDPTAHANASIHFSNIPHNISFELTDRALTYQGDGVVDRLTYTSAIENQYIRLLVEGLPEELTIDQGAASSGMSAALGAIDAIELQIADGGVRRMVGDHLLAEIAEDGTAAASLRITGLGEARYDREANHVSLRSAGEPFSVLIDDRSEGFKARATLDPLPTSIETDVTDVLGLGGLEFPSLAEVTSVLEFASVIHRISDVADQLLDAMTDISTNAIAGLGTFSNDLRLNYTAERGMDLVAEVHHAGGADVPPAEWAHGAVVHQVPHAGEVLLDAKVFMPGLPPTASIGMRTEGDATVIDLDLSGYAPAHDRVTLVLDGASMVSGGTARDVWLYVEGLVAPIDLHLHLELSTDMRVGGQVSGELDLLSSRPLGMLHARMRTREPQTTTVELLMPRVPARADVSFSYTSGVDLTAELSEPIDWAFIKLSRDLHDSLAHAATVTIHDVPRAMTLTVEPPAEFDMDSASPVANLPRVVASGSEGGLDLLADLKGRAMGSKPDIHIDARDVEELSMIPMGDEWRMSATRLAFAHLRIDSLPYSEDAVVKRLDLVVEDLRSLTVKAHMVFGVFPLVDLDDVRAAGVQLSFDASLGLLGGGMHRGTVVLLELPMDLAAVPRSHTNGVVIQAADGDHRLIVPAPMGTLVGTVMG